MGNLQLNDVRKNYGPAEVIKGVSLDVQHGEFIVFVGPSGCGKSTLLRMIAGLEEITAGQVFIDGRMVNTLAPVKRGIAMVFQSYALYPHMSVYENIAFPLRVDRLSAADVEKKVQRAASILQLGERLQHRPGQLSGGQRQRVAIGRAIVREPSVFLFDEPLSNLDAALRADMRVELTKLHGDLDATMIYVTHDQVEAMTMADRIVVLDGGLIAQVGTPLELYHKPQNMFVAGFIGNPKMNFLAVSCTGSSEQGLTVELPGGAVISVPVIAKPGLAGTTMTLGIRPEHLKLHAGAAQIEVTPRVIERLGIYTVTYSTVEGSDRTFCGVLESAAPASVGVKMKVHIDGSDCHIFDDTGKAFERRVPVSEIDPSRLEISGK